MYHQAARSVITLHEVCSMQHGDSTRRFYMRPHVLFYVTCLKSQLLPARSSNIHSSVLLLLLLYTTLAHHQLARRIHLADLDNEYCSGTLHLTDTRIRKPITHGAFSCSRVVKVQT